MRFSIDVNNVSLETLKGSARWPWEKKLETNQKRKINSFCFFFLVFCFEKSTHYQVSTSTCFMSDRQYFGRCINVTFNSKLNGRRVADIINIRILHIIQQRLNVDRSLNKKKKVPTNTSTGTQTFVNWCARRKCSKFLFRLLSIKMGKKENIIVNKKVKNNKKKTARIKRQK